MAEIGPSAADDWIGAHDPPETSAPLHPEGRKRYDPRAPYGTAPGGGTPPPLPPVITGGGTEGFPPGTVYPVCRTGFPLYQNGVKFSGTSLPGATIKIYIADPGPYVGQMIGSGIADIYGNWTVTILRDFPHGFYCVTATQTLPGLTSSDHSDSFCFHVGSCIGSVPPPEQIISFTSEGLRHDPTLGWYPGTLAYKINGVWTYGVLRKVGP